MALQGTNVLTEDQKAIVIQTIIANLNFKFAGKRIAEVHVDVLDRDDNYQRKPDEYHVAKIAAEWDDDSCAVILVSYRDGKLYVIDGWHRVLAARRAGKQTLAAQIYTGLTAQQEANIFRNQDANKGNVSLYDKHRAAVFEGVPEACILDTILGKFHLTIRANHSKENGNTTQCISSLAAVQSILANKDLGPDCLTWVLQLMNDANWFVEKDAGTHANIWSLRYVYEDGMHNNCLTTYRGNLLASMSEVTPVRFRQFAANAYPLKTDVRAHTKALFFAIAKNEVTFQHPVCEPHPAT